LQLLGGLGGLGGIGKGGFDKWLLSIYMITIIFLSVLCANILDCLIENFNLMLLFPMVPLSTIRSQTRTVSTLRKKSSLNRKPESKTLTTDLVV
jgi:hypothetical protein